MASETCPLTNNRRRRCGDCTDTKFYEGGLSFLISNDKVVFVNHDRLIYFTILKTEGEYDWGEGSDWFTKSPNYNRRNGASLIDLNLVQNVEQPPSELNLISFGSKAAVRSNKHLVVSAPGDERGAILFYTLHGEKWVYDERVDGTTTGQHLGSNSLEFLSENTLEVVSHNQILNYYINYLVS